MQREADICDDDDVLTRQRDAIDELVDWQLSMREGAPVEKPTPPVDRAEPPEPHLVRGVIDACTLCDAGGYRPNGYVCDHVDRSEITKRGMRKIRAALSACAKSDCA